MVEQNSRFKPYYNLAGRKIDGFRYLMPLKLERTVEALKARSGEDADYLVAEDYTVEWKLNGESTWRPITVPRGLITDLASVPRVARVIVDRVGPHLEASIVHDYLYLAWQDIPGLDARKEFWEFADEIFLAGMKAANVRWSQRTLIYRSVRTFGWPIFRGLNPVRYANT